MIINNEKDRMQFIRELLSAELPCEVTVIGDDYMLGVRCSQTEYPDYEQQKLGDIPSGHKESEEL